MAATPRCLRRNLPSVRASAGRAVLTAPKVERARAVVMARKAAVSRMARMARMGRMARMAQTDLVVPMNLMAANSLPARRLRGREYDAGMTAAAPASIEP